MDKTQKDAFLEYENIKLEIKAREARLEELKPIIRPCIEEGEEINGTQGVFILKRRDVWKFTEPTVKMAEQLKAIQEDEIAKGVAVSNPTIYVEYKENKKSKKLG